MANKAIYLSVGLCYCAYIYLATFLYIYPYIYLYIHPSNHLSIYLTKVIKQNVCSNTR